MLREILKWLQITDSEEKSWSYLEWATLELRQSKKGEYWARHPTYIHDFSLAERDYTLDIWDKVRSTSHEQKNSSDIIRVEASKQGC